MKNCREAESAFRACQQKLTETEHALLTAEQAGRLEGNHRAYAEKTIQQLESAPYEAGDRAGSFASA